VAMPTTVTTAQNAVTSSLWPRTQRVTAVMRR
jgi:hypothetical protein